MAAADTCQILWVGQQENADQFTQSLEFVDTGSHSPPVKVYCVETGAKALAHLASDHSIDEMLLDLTHPKQLDFDLLQCHG